MGHENAKNSSKRKSAPKSDHERGEENSYLSEQTQFRPLPRAIVKRLSTLLANLLTTAQLNIVRPKIPTKDMMTVRAAITSPTYESEKGIPRHQSKKEKVIIVTFLC
jgi:hypothetical protein